ncbi:MAG: sugar ABC transporter permease, partial [Acidimicrobiales bacterium]
MTAERGRKGEGRAAFGFLALDGLGLLVFVVLPAVLALVIGLFTMDGFGKVEFAGLANYRLMAGDALLWRSFGVTATFTVLFVPTAFVVGLVLALLVRRPFRGVG